MNEIELQLFAFFILSEMAIIIRVPKANNTKLLARGKAFRPRIVQVRFFFSHFEVEVN